MNSVFIIRFHYEKHDPRFEWRFNYFKTEVLPRLLAQTYGDFDIAIRCNPWHEELFKNLSDRIVTFQVKNEGAKYKGLGKQYFYDFCPWEDVIGLKKYELQMGLDSDDLISNNYVEKIIDEVQDFKEKNPKKSLHVSFQPEIYDTNIGETYDIKQQYGPKMGSAFMALYQPDLNNYHFIYERSHLILWQLASKSVTLPTGYCYASVHDLNESTGK